MTMTSPTAQLNCQHGMGNPRACIDCMDEGINLPPSARRAGTGQASTASGFAFDNDCGIQAIVNAIGASYDEAALAMRQAGWVPGQGCLPDQLVAAVESLGFAAKKGPIHRRGSGWIHTDRTYIVCGWTSRKGHAWSCVDGTMQNAGQWMYKATKLCLIEISC